MPPTEAHPTPAESPSSTGSRIPTWLPWLVLIALGLGLRLGVIARTEVAARDSIGFIRYAVRLEREPFLNVIRTAEQPPGYALAVLAVSWPVRAWTGELSCDTMVLSAQLASALMAVASIPFMVLLGRELSDKRLGWIAAAVFLALPGWTRLTSDGLSEGTFLFALALTLWLGARALRAPSAVRFFWSGMAAGAAYLVRPEGVELAAVIGLVLIARQVAPAWRQSWARVAPQAVGLACGTLLVVGPYAATIGRLTNKNAGKIMLGDPNVNRDALPWVAAPAARTPLAVWWYEPLDRGKSKELWGLRAIAVETVQALSYVGAGLAVLGLVRFRAPRGRSGAWLLAALVAVHGAIVWRMAVSIGYFSERHTLVFVYAACFPAAVAVLWLGRRLGGHLRTKALPGPTAATCGVVAILLAASLPSLAKPLHGNRAGHKAAGRWLAAHSTPADEIIDPFNWAHFYSGRLTADPPPTSDRLFAVLETSDNQHSRLPAMADARFAARFGRAVYHYPADKPADQARVIVYEVARPRR